MEAGLLRNQTGVRVQQTEKRTCWQGRDVLAFGCRMGRAGPWQAHVQCSTWNILHKSFDYSELWKSHFAIAFSGGAETALKANRNLPYI